MGTKTAPNMALPRYATMDEIPPTCHHQGVPINNTVFVKPSVTLWSDTCDWNLLTYYNFICIRHSFTNFLISNIFIQCDSVCSFCRHQKHSKVPQYFISYGRIGLLIAPPF